MPQATPVNYSFDLNHLSEEEAGNHTVYTLRATQPQDSKLTGQKIRLAIASTTPQGTFTRLLNLNTGKYKTVAQLCANLRDIFRKDQTLGANAAGQDLGKVGDLKFGGEVHFVAESSTRLRCDILTQGAETHSISFTASEVADLVALLGPTGHQ